MKVLILHHVEPMWAGSFDPDELIKNIIEHIHENEYDKVILTTMESSGGYCELSYLITCEEEWGYAWPDPEEELDWYEDSDIDLNDIIRTTGHEYSYLYDWIKELRGNEVHLAGGHRWECLRDLMESLDHLDIPYKLIESCIYG